MPDSAAASANLTTVQRFLEHVLAGRSAAALDLVSEDHVEHSATIPAGRPGVAQFLEGVAANRDQMELTVLRTIADSRYVVVHLHTRWTREQRSTVAIDIFRVQDGRIVEHWDVVQPVPVESINTTPIV